MLFIIIDRPVAPIDRELRRKITAIVRFKMAVCFLVKRLACIKTASIKELILISTCSIGNAHIYAHMFLQWLNMVSAATLHRI
ncbi:hypothetical protein Ngar_c21020 [Candidatus Nitrososphaera gargensis Ga9.2]|uniref:Uncharacterized protein n=1 Tax=Nitrososphaera gargensis (strain Ga9.2) TaxID=1237085 RepID=K0IIW7_NITGG|nr:hypothetical protein Ngar_c21020 [Candidatus Nitrososphaera gargensis Ga9.2]